MKKKIIPYTITNAQRETVHAAIIALGEVVQAHKAANPEADTFEIELKVSHERKLICWDDGPKTWGFFRVGNFSDGGSGHSLDAALADMFGKTDAGEKRAYAARCRKAAEQAEAEAAELEKATTAEVR